jgi:hypothetical protein
MAQTQTQPETPLIPQSSPELANVRSYNRATMFVDISGLNIEESAGKIKAELDAGFK